MKKNNSRTARPRHRSDERRPFEDQKVIVGHYHKNGTQEFVAVGSTQYIVSDIKRSIERPLPDRVKVKAVLLEKRNGQPTVMIVRLLPPEQSLLTKTERLIAESQVQVEFPRIVHEEANIFGAKVSAADKNKRTNLCDMALCTIDGETAKDFDDAVFARMNGKAIEVTVAIADVSHYVKIGSALDEEAYSRGTSIYYPGHCVPMLPEQLSNGLCSLKPNVDRLALAVTFSVGPKGGLSAIKLREAVIRSQARLTYNQVQAFYDRTLKSAKLIPAEVQTSLTLLRQAAGILRAARERRGAIDFDIVESVIALNETGEPISVNPLDRLDSHRIIEDLMVATNEVVAEYFYKKNTPSIYRVHEPPNQEKLENFFKTAHAFGVLKGGVKTKAAQVTEPLALQKIMATFADSSSKDTLTTLLLRSMMQARYSEKNLKHFGLASSAYLHFTSPIRRYADLIVHRQLRFKLFEKSKKEIPESMMAMIAESISQKEMKATDLERKINRLFAATFMASRLGETFDGVIVSCTEFGCFVRVIEHHVEGLVHIATISKSHVNFMPEKMCLVISGSQRTFMVGQKVRVKLINVNPDRGHIDFEFAEEKRGGKREGAPKEQFSRRPNRTRKSVKKS